MALTGCPVMHFYSGPPMHLLSGVDIRARARKRSRFLLGLADDGASIALTLCATVLAIIAPCLPTEDFAHISRQ